MVALMKTTIDLPDELVREVKRLSAEQGVTMRELMIDGLRSEVERRSAEAPKVDFVFPVVHGGGLQPGVTYENMLDLLYEWPA